MKKIIAITRRDSVTLTLTAGLLYGLVEAARKEGVQIVQLNRNGAPVDFDTFVYWLAEVTRSDVDQVLTFGFVQAPGR